MQCFQIVASSGAAKSSYIEAVSKARDGDVPAARKLVDAGDAAYREGHDVHMAILQKDAADQNTEFSLILVHAEDQMMAAETFRVMALDLIDVYDRIAEGA